MTAHTEQPELLPCPFCGDAPTMSKHFRYDAWNLIHRCKAIGAISFEFTESKESIVSRWNRRAPASQARVPLSAHKQALDFLAGLHPGITIDGPPMAVAELIFDAVQAEQRALKEAIAQKERNLDWMREELAKRAPKAKDCKRPECIARGCFGHCMKGITQEQG